MAFLIYRWILAIFFFIAVAYSVIVNIQRGHFHVYFIYLTHLNLCATMATTWIGAFLVSLDHFNIIDIEKEIKVMMHFYWMLWNQSIVISLVVSISYWGFHYDGEKIDMNNVLIHITNSSVLIVDLLIVNHPPKYLNFVIIIAIELFYALFTLIYQLLGGLDK